MFSSLPETSSVRGGPSRTLLAISAFMVGFFCVGIVFRTEIAYKVGYITDADLAMRQEMIGNLADFRSACTDFREAEHGFDQVALESTPQLSSNAFLEQIDTARSKKVASMATRDRLRDQSGWSRFKSFTLKSYRLTHYQAWWCNNYYADNPVSIDIW